MTVRYEATRSDDPALRERMKAIAHERRRFGCRRLHVLLRREGHVVNHKRLFRLCREEKLAVRRRCASGRSERASRCWSLRAGPQHSPRPGGQNQPPEQTRGWIKVGGNVNPDLHKLDWAQGGEV